MPAACCRQHLSSSYGVGSRVLGFGVYGYHGRLGNPVLHSKLAPRPQTYTLSNENLPSGTTQILWLVLDRLSMDFRFSGLSWVTLSTVRILP